MDVAFLGRLRKKPRARTEEALAQQDHCSVERAEGGTGWKWGGLEEKNLRFSGGT